MQDVSNAWKYGNSRIPSIGRISVKFSKVWKLFMPPNPILQRVQETMGLLSPDSLDEDHPNKWYVKQPKGDFLIVNDYFSDQLNYEVLAHLSESIKRKVEFCK